MSHLNVKTGNNPANVQFAPQYPLAWVTSFFRQHRWKTSTFESLTAPLLSLVISKGDLKYVAELKAVSEGRRDRVIPMLSQVILIARKQAKQIPNAHPLSIVITDQLSDAVVGAFQEFHREYAPEIAVGLLDMSGYRWFAGAGLEDLSVKESPRKHRIIVPAATTSLFSDLNQWMLKLMLAPEIPAELMSGPRLSYRNATQLSKAANVSLMTAFRFLRQMQDEGFLEMRRDGYQLVRRAHLLEKWQASYGSSPSELPAYWASSAWRCLPFTTSLKSAVKDAAGGATHPMRICVGLSSAAKILGFHQAHEAPPHLMLDRVEPRSLEALGISATLRPEPADMLLRIPRTPDTVFRGAIERDGVWMTDVLQTWLDLSTQPGGDKNHADAIRDRYLRSVFEGD